MHFLSVNDFSRDQIDEVFDIADSISEGKTTTSLKENSVMALLFESPSTRTRVAFEVAIAKLGGKAIYLDPRTSQLSRGEPIADTARALSLYVDFIAARMYSHSSVLELADNSTVPVINALTDLEYPTQALSDLYTIINQKRRLKGLRIAFVGDVAQNTCNSLMLGAAKMGAEMSLVGPKNYPPNPQYLTRAREYGVVDLNEDMQDGLADADIVYTDTFVSMGREKEAQERKATFSKYQINSKSLQYAKKDALVMHPLPAFRGEEITEDVLDGPRSIIWEQSKNNMLLAQAIILYLSEKNI